MGANEEDEDDEDGKEGEEELKVFEPNKARNLVIFTKLRPK